MSPLSEVAKTWVLLSLLRRPIYLGLHKADPNGNDGTELAGLLYARQGLKLSAPKEGTVENVGLTQFRALPGATITHVGLWDAPESGNLIWSGPLLTMRVLNEGDRFELPPGMLTLAIRE